MIKNKPISKSQLETMDNARKEIKAYFDRRADLKGWPPLAIDFLKTFTGFENYTYEEADIPIKCYQILLLVLVAYNPEAKIISIDNQKFVNFIQKDELLKIAA